MGDFTPRRMTQSQKERMALDLMREGLPLEDAAGRYGLSRPDLRRMAERENIQVARPSRSAPPPPPPPPPATTTNPAPPPPPPPAPPSAPAGTAQAPQTSAENARPEPEAGTAPPAPPPPAADEEIGPAEPEAEERISDEEAATGEAEDEKAATFAASKDPPLWDKLPPGSMSENMLAEVAPPYPIEDNVPMPNLPFSLWNSLRSLKNPGQSFLVPCAPEAVVKTAERVRSNISRYRQDQKDLQFIYAPTNDGIRVWRKA